MTKTEIHTQKIGIIIALVAIALGMFTVGTSYATGTLWGIGSAQISIDEAAAIGIAHLNTESDNLTAIGMERDDESFIYDLEFEIGDQQVSVEINPYTGEILAVDQEPLEESDDDFGENYFDDSEDNDGKSISDGDGEIEDD